MLRDVFYYGNKPNVHPRERHAPNLEAARYLSTTEHFWIINEFCDYTGFDWDFDFDTLPDEDVWTEKHNNVWPSQHQKDSGTWLCNKTYTDIIYYREDVEPVKRKNIKTEHWEILHPIDESKFDFSWHPDPTEPPYIYRWGCRYFPPTHEPVVQYVMPGATTFKYFDTVVELVPRWDRWKILHDIEMNSFDFCWAPDPTSPPYIYTFGNQHHDAIKMPTLEYHMPNAEERKYVKAQAYTATLKQHPERFEHFEDSHGIDYSWVPDPDSGPYIYAWGNQWNQPEDKISIQYAVQGATTYKYMSERAIRRPCMDNWEVPENVDVTKFDFSWEPSPAEPPFIYQFGTQWQKTGGPRYVVKGATEIKYVDVTKAKAKPVRTNWELPTDTLIDAESFDYSWHPDDTDPPYIYQFGTQWQKTGGPRYVVQGATEIKYVDSIKAKALPNVVNWEVDNGVPLDLNTFDFSWHPDNTETPFIYQFGTQWQKTGGPRYIVQGATEVSYIDIQKAIATPTTDCWEFDISVNIDKDRFDYSWHPDTTENPFIYQFGTQHQKTGGPRYVMQGATEIKYVDQQKAIALEDRSKFEVLTDYVLEFDYSWHPDSSEQPYIYVFGNQHHIAEKMNTVRYVMQGATELKYINDHKATIIPNKSRFKIYTLIDESKFDFSWIPDPNEPPYVYVWGNKHVPGEIYPTVEFVSQEINKVDGSSGRKFIHNEVELLVEWDRWNIIDQIDRNKFDFTWRPDPTAPPYIYAWGSKHVDPETSPAIEYKVPEATEYKFMSDVVEVLPRFENWFEYEKIDRTKFDYTWRPNPKEPPYIYAWGSKHVLNYVGSVIEYRVPGATDYKYMSNDVETLPNKERWKILQPVDESSFDFTWHPCRNDPPYIYVWGNKFVPGELQSTLEYHVPGATDKKYMHDPAPVLPEMDRWTIVQEINKDKFDLTWRPDPREPPYIYVWGNKYIPGEKKPTLMYHMPNATEYKYLGDVDVLPELDRWEIHDRIDETKFDLCWRPDPSEPPYIYVWGNKYVPGEMRPTIEYHCEGATERKYMGDAPILPQEDRWRIHTPIDTEQFDLSWRPDPRDPPYIYVWGNKHVPAELKPTLEYIVPGATEYKYMDNVTILPVMDRYVVHYPVKDFDFTWMPDPREPPYIYVWGNKYIPGEVSPTIEYHCEGASQRKFMSEIVELYPQYENWEIIQQPVNFDFSWVPDPTSMPYIYVWGNKYIPGEKKPTLMYHVKGATEYKYMGNDVEVKPEWDKWKILIPVDKSSFDFSWRPDPSEPPFVYVWGNQSNPADVEPTIEYHADGAYDERKYMHDTVVKALPANENWKILIPIEDFDFSWRPNPGAPPYIYVFGNQWNPANIEPTILFHVPGATEHHYIHDIHATVAQSKDNWEVVVPVEDFDFSWRPNPYDPPYIYVWGNKWIPAEKQPTIKYYTPRATEYKYMGNDVKVEPEWDKWKILIPIDKSSFDFSWRPDPGEPAYVYVWGNQYNAAEVEPTIEYHCEGAYDQRKYMTDQIAKTLPIDDNWETLLPIDEFDFSWRPHPGSPPYIYVFGNQWNSAEIEPTVKYYVKGATDYKYINDIKATVSRTGNWKTLIPVDEFDYSWRPDPREPAFIYVFGNKWNDAATEPTVQYEMEGATGYKYIDFPVAIPRAEMTNWAISNTDDLNTFDFTWRPNPYSPPQIYQWEDNGPRYTVPGASEVVYMKRDASVATIEKKEVPKYYIKTTLEDLIKEHNDEVFWALNPDINYEKFNFGWKPNEKNFRHINVFGNEYAKDTQTYYINGPMYNLGHREYNYIEDQKVEVANTKLSMFYIDRGNVDSSKRFDELKKRFPNIVKTRYLNSWVDTINRCLRKSETSLFWILNSEYDYTNFKFNFYPSPWQMKMVHVFGTQWSHWGHTYLINKETFIEDTKYVKIIEHLNCLNFVKGQRANATDCLYDIYLIDHGNFETSYIESELRNKYDKNKITVVPHNQNYLETFKTIIDNVEDKRENYIWICNSVCGYDDFDFSYISDPFSREQLHVFPSDRQKYGDTFLVNVDKLREQYENMRSLDDYDQINFNQHQRTNRLEAPEFVVEDDTHTEIIHKIDFEFPYVILKTRDNNDIRVKDEEPISLWSNRSKTVTVTTTGATRIIVPKEVKKYIKDEYYDYPFISENIKKASKPLDIVFLSNGESNAEENYQHLLEVTKGLPNRVVRVDGVNGRVAAYHAAAIASNTNWLFTVFAKLKVDKDFDWGWQPDRLRKPKHYIFHALNPVNGLTYGHQAMIAYNKKLTLANSGRGLDFTLDDLHDTVPTLSGVAEFNTDSYSTWRTAFREVIKLKSDYEAVSAERLKVWLSVAEGNFAEDCLRGARDAINYYNEVNGDIDQLKQSYEWDWLKEYYNRKYK